MDFVNDKGVQKAKQMVNKEKKKKKRSRGEKHLSPSQCKAAKTRINLGTLIMIVSFVVMF